MWRTFAVCMLLAIAGNSVAQTFACQYVASSGLIRKSGAWKATEFKTEPPFFLTVNGTTLDEKSVAKVLGASGAKCMGEGAVTCVDNLLDMLYVGNVLYFSTLSARGAVARLWSSTANDDAQEKDALGVSPFVCQQM